ncbi:MAG: isoaspartyl peptidase/L-asparaginase family protein [Candidatus Micrarchaeota archaeon]
MEFEPVIVVHGGAARITDEEKPPQHHYLEAGLLTGWKVLNSSGRAVDAVEEAVALMEDSGAFDAGRGSVLNAEKKVELDAAIMSGDLSLGSVACVSNVCNPVRLARKIMDASPHSLLVGKGAEDFAARHGVRACSMSELVSERELARWTKGYDKPFGTVGAVALDCQGHIAAATSTGGTFRKLPGRIGDSPLVGCGTYADDESGACSTTGHGESFMKTLAAKTACDFLSQSKTAQEAAEKAITHIKKRTGGHGGLILLRKDGDFGIAFNTPVMTRGYMRRGMAEPAVFVNP